jgi:hypothetical protein
LILALIHGPMAPTPSAVEVASIFMLSSSGHFDKSVTGVVGLTTLTTLAQSLSTSYLGMTTLMRSESTT